MRDRPPAATAQVIVILAANDEVKLHGQSIPLNESIELSCQRVGAPQSHALESPPPTLLALDNPKLQSALHLFLPAGRHYRFYRSAPP